MSTEDSVAEAHVARPLGVESAVVATVATADKLVAAGDTCHLIGVVSTTAILGVSAQNWWAFEEMCRRVLGGPPQRRGDLQGITPLYEAHDRSPLQ